jgi:hypothetical protein
VRGVARANAHSLDAAKGLIFRITHIDNVGWLLRNGIHCRNSSVRDPNFREIGNRDLIAKRAHRTIPVPPAGTLSDYVPFYFTPWSPMLMNITTGFNGTPLTQSADIAILVSKVSLLQTGGQMFLITDSHAYLQTATFTPGIAGLRRVDWGLLQVRDFKRSDADPGKFDRYQAEALVHRHVPVAALAGIIVHGPVAHARMQAELRRLALSVKLVQDPDCYFT